jgi:hypothetical protein
MEPCPICGKPFDSSYGRRACSIECRNERHRREMRSRMRRKRHPKKLYGRSCEVCGYYKYVDIYDDGSDRWYLCPNHYTEVTKLGVDVHDLV